ncbi:unnamed protein product [Mucor hiemalis]
MKISISSKWLALAFAILLQISLNVQAQVVEPPTTTVKPSPSPSSKPPVSSIVPPTSQVIPPSTSLSTLQPSVPSSIPVPSSVVPSSSPPPPSTTLSSTTTPPPSSTASSTTSSSVTSSSASPSTTSAPPPPPTNNTPIIVGSVVGGVVGLALIGGVLACINRRGGCTKRRDTKKSEFEDYGLGDFPHHRTQMAAPVIANKPVSPTLPRLNDQGNYYNEDPNYARYGYQDNNVDYGMQPQQGYYYPQQHQQQEYYDDGGYYYDSNTSATAYSNVSPMQPHTQQGYVMNNNVPQTHNMVPQQDVYKPDDVGAPVNTSNANVAHHR